MHFSKIIQHVARRTASVVNLPADGRYDISRNRDNGQQPTAKQQQPRQPFEGNLIHVSTLFRVTFAPSADSKSRLEPRPVRNSKRPNIIAISSFRWPAIS
jgi:hypothetical protein